MCHVLFILVFIFESITGFFMRNKCEGVQFEKPHVCAKLFDDKDCDTDTFSEPFNVPETKGGALELEDHDYESLIVNKGCVLQVFKDSKCQEENYIFSAPGKNEVLVVKELDDTNASTFRKWLRLKDFFKLFKKFNFQIKKLLVSNVHVTLDGFGAEKIGLE